MFKRRAQIRNADSLSATNVSLARFKFEELKAEGDRLALLAREKQVWITLAEL